MNYYFAAIALRKLLQRIMKGVGMNKVVQMIMAAILIIIDLTLCSPSVIRNHGSDCS